MTSKQQLKEQNRVLVILVLGVIIQAWVMINAGDYLKASMLYIALGLISIILILFWEKIG